MLRRSATCGLAAFIAAFELGCAASTGASRPRAGVDVTATSLVNPALLRESAVADDDPTAFAEAWRRGARTELGDDELQVARGAALVLLDDRDDSLASLLASLGDAGTDPSFRAQLARAATANLQALARGRRQTEARALLDAVLTHVDDPWEVCRLEILVEFEAARTPPDALPVACAALEAADRDALARDCELHQAWNAAAFLHRRSDAPDARLLEARALYAAQRPIEASAILSAATTSDPGARLGVAVDARDAAAVADLLDEVELVECGALLDFAQRTVRDGFRQSLVEHEHALRLARGWLARCQGPGVAVDLVVELDDAELLAELVARAPGDATLLELAVGAPGATEDVYLAHVEAMARASNAFDCIDSGAWLHAVAASPLRPSNDVLKRWIEACEPAGADVLELAVELERFGLLDVRRALLARHVALNDGAFGDVALWLADHSADRYEAWNALMDAADQASSATDALALRLRAIEVVVALGDLARAVITVLKTVELADDPITAWPACWSRIAAVLDELDPNAQLLLAEAAFDDAWIAIGPLRALGDLRWQLGDNAGAVEAWMRLVALDVSMVRSLLSAERIAAMPGAAIELLFAIRTASGWTADDVRRYALASAAIAQSMDWPWSERWLAESERAWRKYIDRAGWAGVSRDFLARHALDALLVEHPDATGTFERVEALVTLGAPGETVTGATLDALARSTDFGNKLGRLIRVLAIGGYVDAARIVAERDVVESCGAAEPWWCAEAIGRLCSMTDETECALTIDLHLLERFGASDSIAPFEFGRDVEEARDAVRCVSAVGLLSRFADNTRAAAALDGCVLVGEADMLSDAIVTVARDPQVWIDEARVSAWVAAAGGGPDAWAAVASGLLDGQRSTLALWAAEAALALVPAHEQAYRVRVAALVALEGATSLETLLTDLIDRADLIEASAIWSTWSDVARQRENFELLGEIAVAATGRGLVPMPVDAQSLPRALVAVGRADLLDRVAPVDSSPARDLDAWAEGLAAAGEADRAVETWLLARRADGWSSSEAIWRQTGLDTVIRRDGARAWIDRIIAEAGLASLARNADAAAMIALVALSAGDLDRAWLAVDLAGEPSLDETVAQLFATQSARSVVGPDDPLDLIEGLGALEQQIDAIDVAHQPDDAARVDDAERQLARLERLGFVIESEPLRRALDAVVPGVVAAEPSAPRLAQRVEVWPPVDTIELEAAQARRESTTSAFDQALVAIDAQLHAAQFDEARAAIDRALVDAPDSPGLWSRRARASAGIGDAVAFAAAMERWQSNPGFWSEEAAAIFETCARVGRWDLASTAFDALAAVPWLHDRGWSVWSGSLGALRGALVVVGTVGDPRGIDLLRSRYPEVFADPVEFDLGEAFASAFEAIGDLDAAIELREQVYERTTDDGAAANNLAWTLLTAGLHPERALRLSAESLLRGDDDAALAARLDTYTMALVANGRTEDARRWAAITLAALALDEGLDDAGRDEIEARWAPLLEPAEPTPQPRERRRRR